jgi:hypothetical protein
MHGKSREHIFYLCVTDECIFYIFFSGKRRYLLLDRLINVHSPELTAKSIRIGQCPGKVKTSYSQYARNKVIRYILYMPLILYTSALLLKKKSCKNVWKTRQSSDLDEEWLYIEISIFLLLEKGDSKAASTVF